MTSAQSMTSGCRLAFAQSIAEPGSQGFGGSSRHQLYAVIVPFACSLLLVGLAYALGAALYDSWITGAVAAFLIAISRWQLLSQANPARIASMTAGAQPSTFATSTTTASPSTPRM